MKIIGAFAPPRPEPPPVEVICLREVKAEMLTLGGAIMFAICVVLSVGAIGSLQLASVTNLQRFILWALTGVSWLYFLDSISERLRLVDHAIEFRALFSRHRLIPLQELEAMLLVYQGFNLERGMESIEFRRRGKKPERIALGPCWQHHKLEQFVHSVEEAMKEE